MGGLHKRSGSLRCVMAGVVMVLLATPFASGRALIDPPAALSAVWPSVDYDPAIPTAASVLGFDIGTEMARHDEVSRYFEALAAAAPDRMRLFEYGESWEGRKLIYGVIGNTGNLSRLNEIKQGLAQLADPRRLAKGEAESLIRSLPAVVWLAYSVHGNEPGTTDAALLTAYHLLAARGDARVPKMLDETLVVIVPMQNTYGR